MKNNDNTGLVCRADFGFFDRMNIKRLYNSAFPPSERKPLSIIYSMRKKGKTDIWYFEKNGRFVGFAATINSDSLILIDYLAVSEKHRGEGIGTKMLDRLFEIYRGKGVFVEIEKDDGSDEKQRRKRFYENCGMTSLSTDALLFDVPMELMGLNCTLDFDSYREFYRINYSEYAAKNIKRLRE